MKLFSLKRIQKPIAKVQLSLSSVRQIQLYTRLVQLGFEPTIVREYLGDQVKVFFNFEKVLEQQEDTFFLLFGGDCIPGYLTVHYEDGETETFSSKEISSMEKQYKYGIDVPLID